MADALLDDLRRSVEYFDTHPVAHKMTADEGVAYTH
jgi:hypothetical protein